MAKSIYSREYEAVLEVLKEIRGKAQITQVQLAKRMKTTQSQVSKIERGELRLDIIQLRSICVICGVSLGEFIERLEKELRGRQ